MFRADFKMCKCIMIRLASVVDVIGQNVFCRFGFRFLSSYHGWRTIVTLKISCCI